MRIFYTILFTILTILSAYAVDVDYRVAGRLGWIMPDGKVDKTVNTPNQWVGPIFGGDLSFTFHPNWVALQQWNNAGIGIGVSYWHLGNLILGHAVAPYAYLDIPFYRSKHFAIGIRPGIGAAFMTKTYRNTVPEGHMFVDLQNANQSIGSVSNLYFPEMLFLDFPISYTWAIGLSGGWYHISNGSTRQPNSGYNIFSAELAVKYTVPTSTTSQNLPKESPSDISSHMANKHWAIAISATAGGRQVYYRDQQTFAVASMHIAAYWLAHPIFRLGGGIDVFYDGAYVLRDTYFQKTNLSAAKAGDCWRVGVSVQPEFVIGDFTAGLHIGAYIYDPVKELEPYSETITSPSGRIKRPIFYSYNLLKAGSAGYPDGWLYTEVALRYHLPWHIFLQATMKSHLTKVEFISLGIGFHY